jgi:hypothetical protein
MGSAPVRFTTVRVPCGGQSGESLSAGRNRAWRRPPFPGRLSSRSIAHRAWGARIDGDNEIPCALPAAGVNPKINARLTALAGWRERRRRHRDLCAAPLRRIPKNECGVHRFPPAQPRLVDRSRATGSIPIYRAAQNQGTAAAPSTGEQGVPALAFHGGLSSARPFPPPFSKLNTTARKRKSFFTRFATPRCPPTRSASRPWRRTARARKCPRRVTSRGLGADASGSDGRRSGASRRAGGILEHGVVEHRCRQKLLQLCVLVTV